jgi:uncharacterized membrane protein
VDVRKRIKKPGKRRKRINPVVQFFGSTALLAGVLSALAFAAPSKSGLVFCNRGSQGSIRVAFAYPASQGGWATEGWLHLEPGQCESALPGKLNNRYYYYYAETNGDYFWKGEQQFCVLDTKFTFLSADTQCRGKTAHWAKFRELDTGKDAESYTLNLE